MGFKIGRILGAAVGYAFGGIGGAVVGSVLAGGKKKGPDQSQAPAQQNNQNAAYERQQKVIREEQSRINERLATAQNQTNAGLARANRSRARGGIFGESGNAASNMNSTLG